MTICSCANCGREYNPEHFPIYLPHNPNEMCMSCLEKDLIGFLGQELTNEFDRIDRERIEAERNRIKSRFEILDIR